jgi:transposase-like protein
MRAQAIVRLSQGLTLQQGANEFAVHLNSVEHWRQRWNKDGLIGLYEGHHSGRRRNGVKRSSKHCVTWPTNRAALQEPCCVVLGRTGSGLYLYYLPPYKPRTQQNRESLEAGQILLARILQFKRRRAAQ